MRGFITSRDRIAKATGDESTVNWEDVPAEVAQALLDKISKGKSEEDIPAETKTTCEKCCTMVTLFGHTLTLAEALQILSVGLQIVALIITITIAAKINK